MNCICKEVVPGPDGQKQCKTSHIPYMSMNIATMTRFYSVSLPPARSAPKDANSDSGDAIIDSIVLRSGHSQRLGQQPDSWTGQIPEANRPMVSERKLRTCRKAAKFASSMRSVIGSDGTRVLKPPVPMK